MLKKSEREVTRASCHLVEVNLHAFLAPTASLCELPTADTTNSVEDTVADCGELNLVKSSELGLDLAIQSSSSPATAQVGDRPIELQTKTRENATRRQPWLSRSRLKLVIGVGSPLVITGDGSVLCLPACDHNWNTGASSTLRCICICMLLSCVHLGH